MTISIRRAAATALACCIAVTANAAEQKPDPLAAIAAAAADNRARLNDDGDAFSGPGYDRLVAEGAKAQFFLLGEEHGVAEIPRLAGQLFVDLTEHDYAHVAIEVSPPMATLLDATLRQDGLDGLRAQFAQRGGEPAFIGMAEEAQFLEKVRATSRRRRPILWGADYEVGGDALLIDRLQEIRKPVAAAAALDALAAASDAAWTAYGETGDPGNIFSFSGDPALVEAVENAWPNRSREADQLLTTLRETLTINAFWMKGEGFRSNQRRSAFLRENFLDYWRAEKAAGRAPKVMAKFGASHLVRGRNMSETYDLGALLPEIAAMEGTRAFSVMMLPGAGSMTAVLDPTVWEYKPAPGKDRYGEGVEALTGVAFADAPTLIDLRPLRKLMGPRLSKAQPTLARIVHGYDMLLVMSGSTASVALDHEAPSN